jgi:tryptophanyl-tRNA synthetase
MFVQSQVREHAELHLLLSMVTPLEWLERVPTYREQIDQLKDKDLSTYGFLGYPLLQTADIVMYDADLVPVGEDQVPHIELAREVARRFNFLFGLKAKPELYTNTSEAAQARDKVFFALPIREASWSKDQGAEIKLLSGVREVGVDNFFRQIGRARKFFVYRKVLGEPEPMLTETPRFPGTDGRRMAKSYGNAIWLSEDPDSIRTKVRNMMTDPQRVRRTDPGRPEVCPVFAYHKLFSNPETIAWSDSGCRTAAIGCIECKAAMAEGLIRWIEPIQARRKEYEVNPERVTEILRAGSKKARKVAGKTMRRVREAIFGATRLAKAGSGAAPKAQAALGS